MDFVPEYLTYKISYAKFPVILDPCMDKHSTQVTSANNLLIELLFLGSK